MRAWRVPRHRYGKASAARRIVGFMNRLLLVGVGQAAEATARLARGRTIVGTTRDAAKLPRLAALGITPVPFDPSALEAAAEGADVLVSFPPDGVTDARVAPLLEAAAAVVYVSSTGVYGRHAGRVDERTVPDPEGQKAERRLAAEVAYRGVSARVLRVPALYGASGGLLARLTSGEYRLPGDGAGMVSRLHLDDLAAFVLAAFARGEPGTTYLLGDALPAPHRDVVAFLCEHLVLPFPASAPLDQVSPTLQGDRAVDALAARERLGVTLRFPTYREGYTDLLSRWKPPAL